MNQTEIWTNLLKECCSTPAESGHPTYFATNALESRNKKQKKGNNSSHFNGGEETIESILRTIISVNQFSIYGAVAELCKALSKDSADPYTNAEMQGNLLKEWA